jgi:hypothetical protein
VTELGSVVVSAIPLIAIGWNDGTISIEEHPQSNGQVCDVQSVPNATMNPPPPSVSFHVAEFGLLSNGSAQDKGQEANHECSPMFEINEPEELSSIPTRVPVWVSTITTQPNQRWTNAKVKKKNDRQWDSFPCTIQRSLF